MIKSPPFGLVFVPASTFREDPVILVQRAQQGQIAYVTPHHTMPT